MPNKVLASRVPWSLIVTFALTWAPLIAAQPLERISVHQPGDPGITTGDAMVRPFGAAGRDGRFVTFSRDLGFKPGTPFEDPRRALDSEYLGSGADVFVRDRQAGVTELISVSNTGVPGNARSVIPWISSHGRFVMFASYASNLVDGDENNSWDVFLRDRERAETLLVSRSPVDGMSADHGAFPEILSGDGSVVLFSTFSRDLVPNPTSNWELYAWNRLSEELSLVTLGPDGQGHGYPVATFLQASISDNGEWVAFSVENDGLLLEDQNGEWDVYLRNLITGEVRLVSRSILGPGSAQGRSSFPTMDPNGRWVAFVSAADDLVANDSNGEVDLFLYHLATDTLEAVSLNTDGVPGSGAPFVLPPRSDRSGLRIPFVSQASLVPEDQIEGRLDVYVRDLALARTFWITNSGPEFQGGAFSSITGDGSQVLFGRSTAPGEWQVYYREVSGNGSPRLLSARAGEPANGSTFGWPLGDREALLVTEATNLGDDDNDQYSDVYAIALAAPPATDVPMLKSSLLGFLAVSLSALGVLILYRRDGAGSQSPRTHQR